MNNFHEEMLEEAKKEKNITASDLLAEIKAHISEFYVCEIEGADGVLNLNFFNGQKFKLKVEEV